MLPSSVQEQSTTKAQVENENKIQQLEKTVKKRDATIVNLKNTVTNLQKKLEKATSLQGDSSNNDKNMSKLENIVTKRDRTIQHLQQTLENLKKQMNKGNGEANPQTSTAAVVSGSSAVSQPKAANKSKNKNKKNKKNKTANSDAQAHPINVIQEAESAVSCYSGEHISIDQSETKSYVDDLHEVFRTQVSHQEPENRNLEEKLNDLIQF